MQPAQVIRQFIWSYINFDQMCVILIFGGKYQVDIWVKKAPIFANKIMFCFIRLVEFLKGSLFQVNYSLISRFFAVPY